jgi:hypothetical protein
MSAVSSLDPSAASQLKSLRDEYRDVGVEVIMAGCSGERLALKNIIYINLKFFFYML